MPHPKGLKGIKFVATDTVTTGPFSDVGKQGGVDNPGKMLKGWTSWAERGRRRSHSVTAQDLKFEAKVGRYLTSPSALLHILSERRKAVAILSVSGKNYAGTEGQWSGTGFLVGPNLLLTNNHVLSSIDNVKSARVEFNYEITPENLLNGEGRPPATQVFELDPARLFITSPTKDGLDYTFVWIEDAAAKAFGTIPMERASFTVDRGDMAFIVHHPDGQPKQVSLDDAEVLGIETTVVHYTSDTMEGSSGAPVFDRRGRLIALHHASRSMAATRKDGRTTDIVNEGIKIAAIAIDLEARVRSGGRDASQAETVLREIKGSDTMSGFFGGYGRRIASGRTDVEAVVDTYKGTDQDIDIGFWNIEWLATRYDEPGKIDGAAKVIADLNLDAWGLSEVSLPAVERLVDALSKTYGEKFAFAVSEPTASPKRQQTAMIWKVSSLSGKRVEWPSTVEPLFRQRSDDPDLQLEAVHGKIFDRYPAPYRLRTVGSLPKYSFFVVPLHLKAMDEGSLRRRLATRILARAVEDLMDEGPDDIILGGDMNAPLSSGDFTAIEDAKFLLLGAQDEAEGAFTYVKSPKSSIDNIFLSPTMRQTVGKMDYFIVAKDRTMPNYLDISDHRPVAVRLSLTRSAPEVRSLRREDLDGMIDDLLGAKPERSPAPKKPRKRTVSRKRT